jgi:hypothetical protein
MDIVTLPAGRYVIGDLCYRDEMIWDQMIDHIDGKVHTLYDGRKYVILKTAYGDGGYFDIQDNEYWVDSGTIGILQWDGPELNTPQGRTFEFVSDFQVEYYSGILKFSTVWINTDPVYEEKEEYELEETF